MGNGFNYLRNTSNTSTFRAKALRREVSSMDRENSCAFMLMNIKASRDKK
jgi:hypothetical protein